ncbi:hypothetical protein SAMN05444006_109180 [Allgaiera indica]|nr:hypothetical protein SAMN05444006_109180 [Allgaiera indica]
MRLAAYLSTSRHGIFYFRYPLPADGHPSRKRAHIKVSLGTREPKDAQQLARLLALAGQFILDQPDIRALRRDTMRGHMRKHFGELLREFQVRSPTGGQISG